MRVKKTFPSGLKEAMVQKICTPGGKSISQVSRESGIAMSTLRSWVAKTGKSQKGVPVKDRSAEDKLRVISEVLHLSEQDYGEYLRKHGLHSYEIEEWKKTILAGLKSKGPGRPKKDPELVALEVENKALKKDLRRKEKALAEQTALIVLQKKIQLLYGTEEEEDELT